MEGKKKEKQNSFVFIFLIFFVQDDHHLVAETAVVGFPHSLKGEGVYAYIVVKVNRLLIERRLFERS
jgi:hypothetical protein